MGMSMHDRYYEPEDDVSSDELDYEVGELLKTDEYNPHKFYNFVEAFAARQNEEDVAVIEEMLEKRDFEALGRKLWNMSFEYFEDFAMGKITGQY